MGNEFEDKQVRSEVAIEHEPSGTPKGKKPKPTGAPLLYMVLYGAPELISVCGGSTSHGKWSA